MFLYVLLTLIGFCVLVFFGAIVTMSIFSIIGKKYEFKPAILSIWGLVMVFLLFILKMMY